MKTTLRFFNLAFMALTTVFVVFGLLFNLIGNLQLSTKLFFAASVAFPILLASKGIEYMFQNLLFKALLSILLLSLICALSIVFVFV